MNSPLLALGLALWLSPCALHAATVLFSHSGSSDPTTEGWGRSTANTTVVGSAYDDDGTAVWKIEEPGNASGGTGLYYSAAMNSTVLSTVMTSGWELSATISIPTDDPNSAIAWPTNGNTWLGIIVNESPGVRRYWALIFGRAANGDTLVAANGVTGTRTLSPGYHDYSLVYDPITTVVSIMIDGELWKSDYTGTTASSAGSNSVYWGDNSAQTSAITPRSAYYESVQFAIAPEPSRLLLLGGGFMALLGRRSTRQRTQCHHV